MTVAAVEIASPEITAGKPSSPVLQISGLRKSFDGRHRVLDGIDLTVRPGEFCVLLGPSGSGKSTLLRTIVGLTPLSEGEVIVGGMPLTRRTLKAIRRRLGMVHQSFGLVERLSALHNVMAGTAASASFYSVVTRNYPIADLQRGLDLLDQVGIDTEMAHRPVRTLSGGQRQRVGIARALITDPDLILADEPVASLDPVTARDVLELLSGLPGKTGTGLLCSLHQVNLAREFADRIIALKAGRVVFDGLPEAFAPAEYHHIYERA